MTHGSNNDSTKISSWLQKKAEWRFAWDRRFVVLEGLRLSYRIEENGPVKKCGIIASLLRQVDSNNSHAFRVWLKDGECWTLRAESSEVHQMWVDEITRVLEREALFDAKNTRKGVVLKQGLWTGKWRQRFVELEGCRIAYREKKEGPVRHRYEIVSADVRRGEESKGDELLVTTEGGNSFWLKFTTPEQCEDWMCTMLRGVRRSLPWHWLPVIPLRHPLHCEIGLQFHAASSTTRGGSTVYCYGGSPTSALFRYLPSNDLFVPLVQRGTVVRNLVSIRLSAQHPISFVDALPYEESAHAKLRPPPLLGAAMCTLRGVRSSPQAAASYTDDFNTSAGSSAVVNGSSCTNLVDCLVLVGGRGDSGIIRDATTEVWWCVFSETRGQWTRCAVEKSVLPNRTFHTLSAISPKEAILVGGVDENNQPCSECFSLSWSNEIDDADICFSFPPTITAVTPLPYPLALHAAVVMKDGSLLVVGGGDTSRGSQPTSSHFFRLADVGGSWERVTLEPPLPSMYNITAAAAVIEDKEYVLVLGEPRNARRVPTLYRVIFKDYTKGTVDEIPFVNEFKPQCSYGASMHISDGYLYIIGGRVCGPVENDYESGLPMNEPIRAVIGVREDPANYDERAE
ncbi:hypothetical protein, conserved [Trypanosoma brucei gambiense DAL972]|uniref:PH domain-containing protein n=1 Tax=Trypanosoma brucei gambiense (strain MHOM/CI/86/DAL972) TaxID=679716 RepID=C9ZQX2_TRYB9|nr:hypothetical protein, conserved [Trypanosoma brucei gambiense DAL972]CBH11802.1 hypothetical protein, conserved [Trypanosoma brucei gambiense DAL972]|eukprot:XP_011774087.1 hypothetical protein, conserved [Trypanosoma brucei gambiense DAL972]